MIFIMDMLLLYPALSVSITIQRTDLRTICKIGIIHQIIAVQADFFDKTEIRHEINKKWLSLNFVR